MSDRPNPNPPGDPRRTADLPAPEPGEPDPTADCPALGPDAPDRTTDFSAPGARASDPDTARKGDTSVAPRAPDGETASFHPPPTFDPARTGAYESDPATDTGTPDGAAEAPAGPALPGYEILGELGRGGMGVVYKARQLSLNRVVAVKMILAGPQAAPAAVARFRAEALAVARFQHPNLVQVFEVGEFAGMPFFSLEYVDGSTLAKKIARSPQSPTYAAETVERLARAMQYAHDRGIAHRDLKPANILLGTDGVPKITDFGLAKELEGDSGQTQSGQVMGTPSYMAPEQAEGRLDVGHPADVYALGAILYDLLTGRPPFAGSSVLDTLEMVRTREPVPPSELTAKLPHDLETICLKALQKDTAKRYASAGALADDLRRFLENRPILARPVGRVEKAWRWAKRNPAGAGVVGLALALLVVPSILAGFLTVAEARASESAKNEGEAKVFAQGKQREAEDALASEKIALASEKRAVVEKEAARAAEEGAKNLANDRLRVAREEFNQALLAIREALIPIEQQMRNRASLYPLRLTIVNLMLKRLDEIRKTGEGITTPLDDRTEGVAYSRMGSIYLDGGRVTDAGQVLRKGQPILKKVADQSPAGTPERAVAVFNVSAITSQLADAEWRLGNGARARELRAAALDARKTHVALIEELIKKGVGTDAALNNARFQLADAYGLLAGADLRLGDPGAAAENYLASDKGFAALKTSGTLEVRIRRAEVQTRLGDARLYQHRPDEAEKHYVAALEEHKRLLDLTPESSGLHPLLKTNIAQARLYLGDFRLAARHDPSAAESEYAAALALLAGTLKAVPDNLDVQRRVAATHYRLGVAAGARSGLARLRFAFAAREHLGESLKLRESLAKIDPSDTQQKVELMLVWGRLGRTKEAEKLADELLAIKEMDQQVRFQVVCGLAVASSTAPDAARARALRDRAFTVLAELVRDWKARGQLELEPDLAALRTDPRFEPLVPVRNNR